MIDNEHVYKSTSLPTARTSEAKIAREAPSAIAKLRELRAMDLVDILGLRPHIQEDS